MTYVFADCWRWSCIKNSWWWCNAKATNVLANTRKCIQLKFWKGFTRWKTHVREHTVHLEICSHASTSSYCSTWTEIFEKDLFTHIILAKKNGQQNKLSLIFDFTDISSQVWSRVLPGDTVNVCPWFSTCFSTKYSVRYQCPSPEGHCP